MEIVGHHNKMVLPAGDSARNEFFWKILLMGKYLNEICPLLGRANGLFEGFVDVDGMWENLEPISGNGPQDSPNKLLDITSNFVNVKDFN